MSAHHGHADQINSLTMSKQECIDLIKDDVGSGIVGNIRRLELKRWRRDNTTAPTADRAHETDCQ